MITHARPHALFYSLMLGLLLLVAILSVLGVHFFWQKTYVVPLLFLIAVAVRRFRPFINDWAVFLGAVVLFDSLRGLTYSLTLFFGWPVYSAYAINAERALLNGNLAPAILQDAFHGHHWLDVLTVTAHASHFLVFLIFGMAVWILRHECFATYRRSMLLLMYGGLIVYLLLPTAPPWMASQMGMIPTLQDVHKGMYAASPALNAMFDTNPIAAMPSLHAAFPALCCLLGLRVFGKKAWPLIAYALLVAFTVIYTANHYAVDVLAGWLVAGLAYYLATHTAMPNLIPSRLRISNPAPLVCLALFLCAQAVGNLKVAMDAAMETPVHATYPQLPPPLLATDTVIVKL